MFDGKKALTISTLVVSALVLIWGAYTFLNNGILSPSKGEDVSTTVQNTQKSQTQNQKPSDTSSEEDKSNDKAKDDSSTSQTGKDTGKSTDSSKQTDSNTSSTDEKDERKIEYVEYTVEGGDTLSSIIKEIAKGYTFKEALEIIGEKNKLENPNNITVGQKLYIPVVNVAEKDKYTIKPGDTLTTIAKKLFPKEKLSDAIKLIMEKNDIEDADSITVGQVIVIPEIKEN